MVLACSYLQTSKKKLMDFWVQVYLVLPDFAFFTVPHKCVFYTLKVTPSTSKKIRTRLTAVLVLLGSSGTQPTVSLRCGHIKLCRVLIDK